MPAIGYAIAVIGVLAACLFGQVRRNGALAETLKSTQTELRDAKEDAEHLVEASKRQARQLAQARESARRDAANLNQLTDDGCLDRTLPAGAMDLLGLHNATGGEADAASASRAKKPAVVSR